MATQSITVVPCPCTRTCSKRTARCRLSCAEFKVYEEYKQKEYAARAEAAELRNACIETNYRFKTWRNFAR